MGKTMKGFVVSQTRRILCCFLIVVAVGLMSAQEVSQSGLELGGPRPMVSQPERAPKAMIASANEIASRVGLDILRKGGNAVDAAVAVAVFQVIVNIIDYKMSLRDAVEFPRIHHQGRPDRVDAEPAALIFDVAARLEAMGHAINPKLRAQGDVHAVMVEEGTGWRLGWSDGRRGGRAVGY
jgi:gamma-glutamyltranspeptidase/glutathione hydrolase